jgi:hypothetical protein
MIQSGDSLSFYLMFLQGSLSFIFVCFIKHIYQNMIDAHHKILYDEGRRLKVEPVALYESHQVMRLGQVVCSSVVLKVTSQ